MIKGAVQTMNTTSFEVIEECPCPLCKDSDITGMIECQIDVDDFVYRLCPDCDGSGSASVTFNWDDSLQQLVWDEKEYRADEASPIFQLMLDSSGAMLCRDELIMPNTESIPYYWDSVTNPEYNAAPPVFLTFNNFHSDPALDDLARAMYLVGRLPKDDSLALPL